MNTMPTWAKLIPYLRIENLKNHTLSLSRGTYLYSPYMGVPYPLGEQVGKLFFMYLKSVNTLARLTDSCRGECHEMSRFGI